MLSVVPAQYHGYSAKKMLA